MEHPHHIRHLCSVKVGEVEGCQRFAKTEHPVHLRHLCSVKVGEVECRQRDATTEHPAHTRHLCSVKVGEVERRQRLATLEHPAHIRHLCSVKVGEVERCQRFATHEHHTHFCHLRGVEVFKTFDAFKRSEICKPSCRGGGAKITERSIKDNSENGGIRRFPISSPSWETPDISIPYSPLCAVAFGTEGVVIEGEGL